MRRTWKRFLAGSLAAVMVFSIPMGYVSAADIGRRASHLRLEGADIPQLLPRLIRNKINQRFSDST